MGQQIRILDLAEDLIRLSGLEPGKDIEIVFTGVRSGEKLSEDLWENDTCFRPTSHPEIFRLECPEGLSGDALNKSVDELVHLAYEGESQAVLNLLDELIPGAKVRAMPIPEMTSID
jgi:FlaA1/EpsC-like NDP-sugar epimerase